MVTKLEESSKGSSMYKVLYFHSIIRTTREKSNFAFAIQEKENFFRNKKNILNFGYTNIIFADYNIKSMYRLADLIPTVY